jgi:hypothetical protein
MVFGMIKSRRMRWVEHVTRMKLRRGAYRVVGKLEGKGKRPLGRSKFRLRMILKWILKKWDG